MPTYFHGDDALDRFPSEMDADATLPSDMLDAEQGISLGGPPLDLLYTEEIEEALLDSPTAHEGELSPEAEPPVEEGLEDHVRGLRRHKVLPASFAG